MSRDTTVPVPGGAGGGTGRSLVLNIVGFAVTQVEFKSHHFLAG